MGKQIKPQASEKEKTQVQKVPFWEAHSGWTLLGLLLLLLLIQFYPMFFLGKTLLPPDAVASYSFRPFVDDALKRGIYPLWNPYIFGGMPFFASLSAPFIDPVNDIGIGLSYLLVALFHKMDLVELQRIFLFLLNHVLLGWSMYILLRYKKLSKSVALYGAAIFMLMPPIVAYSAFGHNTKLATTVLLPLLLLVMDALLEKQNLLFFSIAGLLVGIQFLRAHVQICYYTHLMLALYFIVWAIGKFKEKEKKRIFSGGALWIGALVCGVLLSSVLTFSVWEYSHYSIRGGETGGVGYEYATGWSFSPLELTTFFIPSFVGFGKETYWGPMPFTDYPLYFGLTTLILAGIALILYKDRKVRFFGLLSLLALFASFGKHFPILYWPMYKFLPFFNKFRAPNMIHILIQLSMVVLAGFALERLIHWKENSQSKDALRIKRYFWAIGAVLGLLFCILLFGKSLYLNWASKAGDAREMAYTMALEDALKAMVLFGIVSTVIHMRIKGRIGAQNLVFIVLLLTLVDFWMINRKFVEFRPRTDVKEYFKATREVEFLKNQPKPFRIFPLQDERAPNWYAYHFLENVWGYHPAKIRRVQELYDALGLPQQFLFKYVKQVEGGYAWRSPEEISPQQMKAHRAFLQMMNVRYVLVPYLLPDSTLWPVSPPPYSGACAVYEFSQALPRAFFPKSILVAKEKSAILRYMASGYFDPQETAVLEEPLPMEIQFSPKNRAEIVKHDIHEIELKADVVTPCLLVLSEIYYPCGWKAFVDGKETKIYVANYVLRALFLSPGAHEIRMVFKPEKFGLGLWITFSTAGVLLVAVLVGALYSRKRSISTVEKVS